MLAALAYSGAELGTGAWAWVLAIAAPAAAAVAWGMYVAPKARHPVATSTRLAIEAVIFGSAAAGLIAGWAAGVRDRRWRWQRRSPR